MQNPLILIINPGSTSTKIAIFKGAEKVYKENIPHTAEELSIYANITDQIEFREKTIINNLLNHGYDLSEINCISARGGLLKPLKSGIYFVNGKMVKDLTECKYGQHASNLGAIIAYNLSLINNIPAYISDPVTVDEMQIEARYSGLKGITRKSIFHALNQKYVARKVSKQLNNEYENLNLIVVHLGGGISVGAHSHGKVIDVNNALNGDGPFTPERAGSLPTISFIKFCFSGLFTKNEIIKKLAGKGGMVSHLNTNDALAVEILALNGDKKNKLILDGMIYQLSKCIGEMSTVLKGKVDGIIITGGMARSEYIIDELKNYIGFIAPLYIFPGENEMEALAENGLNAFLSLKKPEIYE
jgi:butyrate kinase